MNVKKAQEAVSNEEAAIKENLVSGSHRDCQYSTAKGFLKADELYRPLVEALIALHKKVYLHFPGEGLEVAEKCPGCKVLDYHRRIILGETNE